VAAKSEAGVSEDTESQGGEHLEKHYVPILELFRGYWSGLVLQCGYEACEYCVHMYMAVIAAALGLPWQDVCFCPACSRCCTPAGAAIF
jgi:hypothetical protein